MAGANVQLEHVLEEVLRAEQDDEDDVAADGAQEGAEQAGELDEKQACGPLEGFSSEELTPQIEGASEADTSFVTTSALDGVQLFFARGVPARPQSFPIEPDFRDVLVRTVRLVRKRAPRDFGQLVRITSAGAFVQKPGFHGLARAFDHDAWTFEQVDIRPIRGDHVASSRAARQRYWALAAIMRSQSAFVLHGHFDAAHEDHIHQDNGGPRAFTTTSEATVKLVQAVCNHIHRESPALEIDGKFGEFTGKAVRRAMMRLDLDGDLFDQRQWKRFLLRSGRLGFKLSTQD